MMVLAPTAAHVCRFVLACLMALPLAAPASGASPASAQRHFDMPRQPLAAALAQYQSQADVSLVYDSGRVPAHEAPRVLGWLTPAEALNRLLSGSGLTVRHDFEDVAVLVPVEPAVRQAGKTANGSALRRHYYAQLQARVTAALCRDPETRPGAYRLAMRLWLDASNRVQRVAIAPTGDVERDGRLQRVLGGLSLEGLPPIAVAQPLSLLIERQAQPGRDCHAG